MDEVLKNLMAYCAVPLTGWHLYMRLYRRMDESGISEPPDIQFFLIFTVYAGWLMVFFIRLSGAWSDVMFLVLVYLIFVAPILMLYVIVSLIPQRRLSTYHAGALMASGAYVGICLLLLVFSFLVVLMRPFEFHG